MENENQRYLSMVDESWLWNKRLGLLIFENISKISTKEAVRDLPKIASSKFGMQTLSTWEANQSQF